jgi:uncharacterized protein affecting Mg2+/Co2+ transport
MSDSRYQVDVSVVTRYLADQSQPEHDRFAFAYTITVQNNGAIPAKLLSRHWVITDGDGHVEEVRGAGVVGKQPLIEVGESHTYSSGTKWLPTTANISTPSSNLSAWRCPEPCTDGDVCRRRPARLP